MSIALLRQWLGPAAPSPHDTELRRLVRDALIEHDAQVHAMREAPGYQRCIEYLLPGECEERPYVALPGDVVAYSTHCRDGCGGRVEGDGDERR